MTCQTWPPKNCTQHIPGWGCDHAPCASGSSLSRSTRTSWSKSLVFGWFSGPFLNGRDVNRPHYSSIEMLLGGAVSKKVEQHALFKTFFNHNVCEILWRSTCSLHVSNYVMSLGCVETFVSQKQTTFHRILGSLKRAWPFCVTRIRRSFWNVLKASFLCSMIVFVIVFEVRPYE